MTEEEKAFKDTQKERARQIRKEAYARSKAFKKQKTDQLKSQEKKDKIESLKQKLEENKNTLDFDKLKLVKFDEDSETFQPVKEPPKLRLVKFDQE